MTDVTIIITREDDQGVEREISVGISCSPAEPATYRQPGCDASYDVDWSLDDEGQHVGLTAAEEEEAAEAAIEQVVADAEAVEDRLVDRYIAQRKGEL